MPTATAPARRRTRQLVSLTGLTAIDAITRVRGLELRPAVEPCDGGPDDHGLVLAQDPAPGTQVGRGQLVMLLVGECSGRPDPPQIGPARAEPAPAPRSVENPVLPSRPQRAAEPVAPRRAREHLSEPPEPGTDSVPSTLFSPEPVFPPAPPPSPGEPELDHGRPAVRSAPPEPPIPARPHRTPPGSHRRWRLLALSAMGIATGAVTLSLAPETPRLTDPAAQRIAPTAPRPQPNERQRHRDRRPRSHHASSRSTPPARSAGSNPKAVTAPVPTGEIPHPPRVISVAEPPARAARPAQPDPVSPTGPAPGPPPSQTGGNP